MPRNNRSPLYFIVIVTISLVVLVIVSSFPGNFLNQLSSPFSVVLEPVQKSVHGSAVKMKRSDSKTPPSETR